MSSRVDSSAGHHGRRRVEPAGGDPVGLVRRVVRRYGGRYSTALGIDVDAGETEVERWFLAATLFGNRIATTIAMRTYRVLHDAGVTAVGRAGAVSWQRLVSLLDEGGYTRYDFQTATRLQTLAAVLAEQYGGRVAELSRQAPTYPGLRAALDTLPGWGPVTIELFLRELRGVWPGAAPPMATRATRAAAHLHLLDGGTAGDDLARLARVARLAGLDARDVEAALVRLALAHRDMATCAGGPGCTALTDDRTNGARAGPPW